MFRHRWILLLLELHPSRPHSFPLRTKLGVGEFFSPMESHMALTYSIGWIPVRSFDPLKYPTFGAPYHVATLLSFRSPKSLVIVWDLALVVTMMRHPMWAGYGTIWVEVVREYCSVWGEMWLDRFRLRELNLDIRESSIDFTKGLGPGPLVGQNIIELYPDPRMFYGVISWWSKIQMSNQSYSGQNLADNVVA